MADKVDDFNYILVDTEFDALILENSLIKRYMPHYNILLRDDKGYPFIRIDVDAPYPTMSIANKKREGDTARYFGPYGGHGTTKQIISSVCRALRLPDCGRVFPRDIGKERPCLHYHTGDCEGWCLCSANGEEYRERIDQAVLILEGRSAELLAAMKEKMLAAADELKFEYAAAIRDRMKAIEEISNAENELTASIAASGAPRITKASLVKTSGKDFRRVSENSRRSKLLEL